MRILILSFCLFARLAVAQQQAIQLGYQLGNQHLKYMAFEVSLLSQRNERLWSAGHLTLMQATQTNQNISIRSERMYQIQFGQKYRISPRTTKAGIYAETGFSFLLDRLGLLNRPNDIYYYDPAIFCDCDFPYYLNTNSTIGYAGAYSRLEGVLQLSTFLGLHLETGYAFYPRRAKAGGHIHGLQVQLGASYAW